MKQQGYQTNGQRNQDLNANYAPTEFVRIPVNKQAVLENGVVAAKDAEQARLLREIESEKQTGANLPGKKEKSCLAASLRSQW